MSLEDLKHNIQSILEGIEKYDSIVEHSKSIENKRQIKKMNKEMEKTKHFVLKLSKKLFKLVNHERRKIKA